MSDFKQYNKHSNSVKRILSEYKEIKSSKSSYYTAAPLGENLHEWHFTIRGPRETEFEGGVYHGRILLPEEYPLKPPDIIFSTENGRFEVEKKICLTISSHHEETWMPGWSIRTALIALIDFMTTKGGGAIASLDLSKEIRKRMAKASLSFKCDRCGTHNITALPPEDINDVLEGIPEQMEIRDSSKKENVNNQNGEDKMIEKEEDQKYLTNDKQNLTNDQQQYIANNPQYITNEHQHLTNEHPMFNDNLNTLIETQHPIENKNVETTHRMTHHRRQKTNDSHQSQPNPEVRRHSTLFKYILEGIILILLMAIFIMTKNIMSKEYPHDRTFDYS